VDDSLNIFEEEAIFTPFFQALENAKELKNIDLEFAIGELFLSPYTHFFSSILKRLPKIETAKISVFEKDVVVDENNKAEENGENCINLSLFFDCCPDLKNLQSFSISMPNYYFGYINLLQKFPKLHTFILGTQETLFFEKISSQIERMLKSLNTNDIEVLDFEFTETLTSAALLKRLTSYKKFQNLRYLSSRFKISNMKEGVAKEIGLSLQGFKKLTHLYVAFENFEDEFKGFKDYIKYHHSIKDYSIIFIDPK